MNPILVSLFGNDENLSGRKKAKKTARKKINWKKRLLPAAAVALGPVATSVYIAKKLKDRKKRKKAQSVLSITRQNREDAQTVKNVVDAVAPTIDEAQETAEPQQPEAENPENGEKEGSAEDEEEEEPEGELGFLGLTTDEEIAKKIFEATGDKVFKGFGPRNWKTNLVVKMRDVHEQLQKSKPAYTAKEASWKMPEVSENAHRYFMQNKDKIKGIIDKPSDILKPLRPVLLVAGLAAAAVIAVQVMPLIKPAKK